MTFVAEEPRTLSSNERRRHPRREVAGSMSVAWLRFQGRVVPAQIADESAGGLGLLVRQQLPLRPGDALVLDRLHPPVETFAAVVRHVEPYDDDASVFLGVEWSSTAW